MLESAGEWTQVPSRSTINLQSSTHAVETPFFEQVFQSVQQTPQRGNTPAPNDELSRSWYLSLGFMNPSKPEVENLHERKRAPDVSLTSHSLRTIPT